MSRTKALENVKLTSFDDLFGGKNIEKAAEVAGVQVLRHNAAGVLDGHLPSAEIHHRGACRYMDVIELGALEFAHYWVPPL